MNAQAAAPSSRPLIRWLKPKLGAGELLGTAWAAVCLAYFALLIWATEQSPFEEALQRSTIDLILTWDFRILMCLSVITPGAIAGSVIERGLVKRIATHRLPFRRHRLGSVLGCSLAAFAGYPMAFFASLMIVGHFPVLIDSYVGGMAPLVVWLFVMGATVLLDIVGAAVGMLTGCGLHWLGSLVMSAVPLAGSGLPDA